MSEIKFFDKALTIKELNTIPVGQPIGLIYTDDFGIPANELINYVQSLGGISSLSISPLISFENKKTILKNYLSYGEYINSPTLFDTSLVLFKSYKKINEDVLESDFLTFSEIISLTIDFDDYFKKIDNFFSSLFYMIYFMCIKRLNDCTKAKEFYPTECISTESTPDFFKHLLKYQFLFDLYKLGIKDNPIYYTDLYDVHKDEINKLILSKDNYIGNFLMNLSTNKKLHDLFMKKKMKNQ